MKSIFDNISRKCSKLTTKTYSTSFSLGITALDKKLHEHIYSIYGFVRFADEIVDSFHEYNKHKLLSKFKDDTFLAIKEKISLNPILNSFQYVVNKYNIDHELINHFLNSMEMDIEGKKYNNEKYKQYILGSAEVVGLMCLHVFVNGEKAEFNKLKPYAMKLGSAFQKVNFLRDAGADYDQLGRTYFPDLDMQSFNENQKIKIEEDIDEEFQESLIGIKMLPNSSKGGVYLAYVYYYALFTKIKKIPANKILKSRTRISNSYKIILMIKSLIKYHLKIV